jgi:3-methyladenine DNA glycosylase Mpg
MRCQLCRNLEQAFEARRSEYMQASSFAYYSVTTKFAAYMNVEMERALNELQEHRSICLSSSSEVTAMPAIARVGMKPQESVRFGPIESAA